MNMPINTLLNQQSNTHYPFGDLLTTRERSYLVDHSHIKMYNKGEIICRQNHIEDVLYIILMGEVDVIEEHNESKKLILGKLHTGDIVGEIAALFTVPRIASVYAIKPTVALEVTASDFNELLNRTPLLNKIVHQKLYERSLETAMRSAGNTSDGESPATAITKMMSCWQSSKIN